MPERNPDLAISHAHLGLVAQSEGQFTLALAEIEAVLDSRRGTDRFGNTWLACAPKWRNPRRPFRVGRMQLSSRRAPDLHLSLGTALQDEGRLDEAEVQYHTAVELHPRSAAAQLRLGGLFEERGELSAAEVAFVRP